MNLEKLDEIYWNISVSAKRNAGFLMINSAAIFWNVWRPAVKVTERLATRMRLTPEHLRSLLTFDCAADN